MIGEIGGDARSGAAASSRKISTPSGLRLRGWNHAPPGKRMGHAGGIISGGRARPPTSSRPWRRRHPRDPQPGRLRSRGGPVPARLAGCHDRGRLIGLGRWGGGSFVSWRAGEFRWRRSASGIRRPASASWPPTWLSPGQDTAAGPWQAPSGRRGGADLGVAPCLSCWISPQEVDWRAVRRTLWWRPAAIPPPWPRWPPWPAGRSGWWSSPLRPAASVTLVRGVNIAATTPPPSTDLLLDLHRKRTGPVLWSWTGTGFGVAGERHHITRLYGDGLLDAARAEAAAGPLGVDVRPVASQLGTQTRNSAPVAAGPGH